MSVVPGSVYANATTPCFAPAGSGGGGGYPLDASFNTVNFLPNNAPSSYPASLASFQDASGNWRLSAVNPSALMDVVQVGTIQMFGEGDVPSAPFVKVEAGNNGLDWILSLASGQTPISVVSNSMSLSNVALLNGKGLPQSGVSDTVGTSNIVTLPYAYTDASYAVCVSPYTSFSTDTLSAQPIDSNSFSVVGSGSNVKYSWITMPWT